MINIEGRVLAGLDEFMLRSGHLTLLCRLAHDVGGSWGRIHREAAEKLSLPVTVTVERNREVAAYLAMKELCKHRDQKRTSPRSTDDYRYPDLEVYSDSSGELQVRTVGTAEIKVWWQDRNLSYEQVRSRVGALTWSAKAGSKTGLSHVCDWAQFLELLDSNGQLSPIGRLLIAITGYEDAAFEDWNPYVLGPERLILAYQYFRKDFDLFARLAPLLLNARQPLTKSTCRDLFVQALQACVADSEASQTAAPRLRFELFQQLRDLERSANRSNVAIEETSTAWHRTASRVETLTDLGLLDKDRKCEDEKYQYVYYPTPKLKNAVESFEHVETSDEWIDQHMLSVVLDTTSATQQVVVPDEELIPILTRIVDALKLPTTQLPIDCLALGIAYLNARASRHQPLAQVRNLVEELPLRYPSIARLARGREGNRAEYISLHMRKMSRE